ncbi:hypothetical protein FRC04_007344 [Tulasnella sp. 424]|nr:hypothetical protein FRC04_007344 [Tulasnella sp. 424]KAG8959677.1 hypothetical protein FRC05_007594 [Tulasnella sp. 425]
MPPQPLPANDYPSDSPHFHAYERCLELERSEEKASGNSSIPPKICGRILGYMMREAPTSDGCDNVQREIESCESDEVLHALAHFYAMFFLRLFKKSKGPIPESSSHPSRPSFDETQDTILNLLREAPKSNSAVKKLALIRDNYRCVVTGAYDWVTCQERRENDPTFEEPETAQFTQLAHIFPDSLNQDLVWPAGLPGRKANYSATAWAVVQRFGQVNVITESLNGPNIHRVENALTMCQIVRELFDRLELWFEATDVPNTYRMCSNNPATFKLALPPIPPKVTLRSTNSSIALPRSDYLRIHAACAKIAHLSGAAEYFQTILKEWEERPVLASDGGSADVLRFLLARAVPAH